MEVDQAWTLEVGQAFVLVVVVIQVGQASVQADQASALMRQAFVLAVQVVVGQVAAGTRVVEILPAFAQVVVVNFVQVVQAVAAFRVAAGDEVALIDPGNQAATVEVENFAAVVDLGTALFAAYLVAEDQIFLVA